VALEFEILRPGKLTDVGFPDYAFFQQQDFREDSRRDSISFPPAGGVIVVAQDSGGLGCAFIAFTKAPKMTGNDFRVTNPLESMGLHTVYTGLALASFGGPESVYVGTWVIRDLYVLLAVMLLLQRNNDLAWGGFAPANGLCANHWTTAIGLFG
jgi:hypothetical protein